MLRRIMDEPNSPLERIVPALIPLFVEGATHQEAALQRGYEIAKFFDLNPVKLELSTVHQHLRECAELGLGIKSNSWAAGQLVSQIRTPALYYLTTLLTQEGLKSIVCGTTNRDEGAYLGFYCKSSDGMVDIQLISDIHKSEVYQLAEYLSVPKSVQTAPPSGDTYDGKPDEEMLGVSYDFVELYLQYLAQKSTALKTQLPQTWSQAAKEQFHQGAEKLELRHRNNQHKYHDGTPAIHFDIYERTVPGGWTQNQIIDAGITLIKSDQFVGFFNLKKNVIEQFIQHSPNDGNKTYREAIKDFGDSAYLVRNLLNLDEVDSLCQQICRENLVPADINGKPINSAWLNDS
jgi:NAD+ synthetase